MSPRLCTAGAVPGVPILCSLICRASLGTQTPVTSQQWGHLLLYFSLLAFIGQHFSATLAARQALSEQAGGSLCWQLPVSFLVSPGALALSPLSVYSLRSPDISRAVETPARVQQSQTCHYISLCRERNRADAARRELPWGWGHLCRCRDRHTYAGTI